MKTLAISENVKVESSFEKVFLSTKSVEHLLIGDFYGDPDGAIIDWDERWVIMFGNGIIIYNLNGSYSPYNCNNKTNQWVELYRETENEKPKWVIALEQVEVNKVRFCTDLNDQPKVFELNVLTFELIEFNSLK